MFNFWNDSVMKALSLRLIPVLLWVKTQAGYARSSERWQEESDIISECKCHPCNSLGYQCVSRCQECVKLILRIWYAFLLTFSGLYTPLPISLVCLLHQCFHCAEFSFFTFDFYVRTHDPSSHLSVQWLLLTWTHPLRFQTVWLLVSSCPRFSCHSLPPTCFPLPPHSLSPSSMVTSSPAMFLLSSCPPFRPPLFLPPHSPLWHLKQGHWQGSNVHLHLCSKCHWAISKVITCPWKSSKEQGKRHVDWQPPLAQNHGCF